MSYHNDKSYPPVFPVNSVARHTTANAVKSNALSAGKGHIEKKNINLSQNCDTQPFFDKDIDICIYRYRLNFLIILDDPFSQSENLKRGKARQFNKALYHERHRVITFGGLFGKHFGSGET